MGDICRASTAGSGPARLRMLASALGASGARCSTTKTDASKSAGKPATRRVRASTPPADAPTTTISCPFALVVTWLLEERQAHYKRGALRVVLLDLDRPVVSRHDGVCEIQAYS